MNTVTRRKDTRTRRVILHKVADIPGGVSVDISELGDDFLNEGSVLTAPVSGVCHVVKSAKVLTAVDAGGKAIHVSKFSQLKVGDFVMSGTGGVAYAISSIDKSNSGYDIVNVATTLGALAVGDFIAQAAAESATDTSALKYTPFSIVGTGEPVIADTNLVTDAVVMAVTKGNDLPSFIMSYLKSIINY